MKKSLYLLGALALTGFASCSKKTDPGTTLPVVTTLDVRGSITKDTHWTAGTTYRLRGYVYVDNNVTLTIDPGTKIVSNKDSAGVLIVYKGSKIIAAGTASKPII